MVPIRENGEAFYVAVNDPVNLLPLEDLRLLLGGPVEPVLCTKADIQAVIDSYFDQQGENASHIVNYDTGTWGCDCDFFASRQVCSHTMTMERVLENMVEFGVTAD